MSVLEKMATDEIVGVGTRQAYVPQAEPTTAKIMNSIYTQGVDKGVVSSFHNTL